MRLILVRHGETAHNAEGRTLGRADVPLTERGHAQARALGVAIAAGVHGEPVAVYASPLQRALDTARPFAEALRLDVQVDERLIEMDVGDLEDIPKAAVRQHHQEFLADWLSDDVADVRMPGGETLREVQERAWAATGALRERHAEETVAVVSHNFVLLALLCRALDLPLSGFRRLRHDVAAVALVDMTPERTTVLTLNDRCHLRDG